MNPMAAAINKRRMGSDDQSPKGLMQDQAGSQPESEDGNVDLQGLVESLSDDQKAELMGVLQDNMSDNSAQVAKGDPSQAEKQEVLQRADGEGISEDESDDIGASMLDSKYKSGAPEMKPRNLGERVKMTIANKLKGKGKI